MWMAFKIFKWSQYFDNVLWLCLILTSFYPNLIISNRFDGISNAFRVSEER